MKPTIKGLILGLFLINLPLSVGRALHDADSSLAAHSEANNLARRSPVIIVSGGKGGGSGSGSGKGSGGKTGGGGKGGTPGDDDGAPGSSAVKDGPIDLEDFHANYHLSESPTTINGARKPQEDRKTPDSDASTDLVDLGSYLNIKTELSQPFTAITVNGGSRTIDGAITEINVPAADSLRPGQKTIVIGEQQFKSRDYHFYHDEKEVRGTKRVVPEAGHRSQTEIQAYILIERDLKPDIVIRRSVVNEETQRIIREGVEKFGQGSNHATLRPGTGEPGMTVLYDEALKSDNLRPSVKGMADYPTYFEGRVPTQVDVVWIADDPGSSIIAVSFEKK